MYSKTDKKLKQARELFFRVKMSLLNKNLKNDRILQLANRHHNLRNKIIELEELLNE